MRNDVKAPQVFCNLSLASIPSILNKLKETQRLFPEDAYYVFTFEPRRNLQFGIRNLLETSFGAILRLQHCVLKGVRVLEEAKHL